jgi:hypothetical protein
MLAGTAARAKQQLRNHTYSSTNCAVKGSLNQVWKITIAKRLPVTVATIAADQANPQVHVTPNT